MSSQGSAQDGSTWAWIDESRMGPYDANKNYYGLQLINLRSHRCLTAPDPSNGTNGEGPVTTEVCDTNNTRQWWSAQYVK